MRRWPDHPRRRGLFWSPPALLALTVRYLEACVCSNISVDTKFALVVTRERHAKRFTMVMTLFSSQWMIVQTTCVCGTSFLTSTCSVVGSTNNGSTTENTFPSPCDLLPSIPPSLRPTSFQPLSNPTPTPD